MLTPLSVERIAGLLRQRGDVFFIDSARRLGGDWNRVFFYFLLQGDDREALEVRADYPGTVSTVHLEKVREVIDDSNRRFPLVKGFYRINDNGLIRVVGSHGVDYEHGATDTQILHQIDSVIGAVLGLFDSLDLALGR